MAAAVKPGRRSFYIFVLFTSLCIRFSIQDIKTRVFESLLFTFVFEKKNKTATEVPEIHLNTHGEAVLY